MAKTITLTVDDSVYDTISRAAEGDRRTIPRFIENAAISYIFDNTVDDDEMDEIMSFEESLKSGLDDIREGRYKVIG